MSTLPDQRIDDKSILIIIVTTASALIFGLFHTVESNEKKTDQVKAEIIEAVIYANSLEKQLWETKEKFTSREQVYDHYRQGFSDGLATNMTDYSWSNTSGLIPGDYATLPPEKVYIIKFDDSNATVYFETPKGLQSENTWGLKKYTIDKLRKEKGRWLIIHSAVTDSKPKTP